MTVEEALLALLAVVAFVLLFLGLAEALDKRFPRGPRRRPRRPRGLMPAAAARPGRERVTADGPTAGKPLPAAGASVTRAPDPSAGRAADGLPGDETPTTAKTGPPRALPVTDDQTGEPVPALGVDGSASVPSRIEGAEPTLARLEACAGLLLAGKYWELLAMAEGSLGRQAPSDSTPAPHAATALWSVVALAHRALGDEAAAQAAFASALGAGPESVADACPPRLAAVSLPIARRLLAAAEQFPEGVEARILASRLAVFWLRWRRMAAPEDATAEAILRTTTEALSDAYADVATGFIRSQQWSEAWRLIEDGRDRHELPLARAELLMGLLATSLRRETERLTAPAIRGTKNEHRAVTALERAENILASMAKTELPPRQRAAITRRIGRAYAILGVRRSRAGNLEQATEALLRALAMTEIGGRVERQVRDAMIHVLESMTDQSAESITTLLAHGDQAGAVDRVERLAFRIERVREAGIAEQDLAVASGKLRQLAQQVGAAATP